MALSCTRRRSGQMLRTIYSPKSSGALTQLPQEVEEFPSTEVLRSYGDVALRATVSGHGGLCIMPKDLQCLPFPSRLFSGWDGVSLPRVRRDSRSGGEKECRLGGCCTRGRYSGLQEDRLSPSQ